MVRNYLKIAWRNLWKHKGFSFINIGGLALGLSCFILIALYVADEVSYDRYNEKAERIFRINSDIRFGGTDLIMAVSADPMGATLKKDYPQVEQYTRFYNSDGAKLIKHGDEFITEERVTHADSTLFKVFTLPAIAGDTDTALNDPNTVVITESTAKKYFGSVSAALGNTIETDADNGVYKVTAIIEDVPRNSHFNYDFFFSMDNVDYTFGNFLSHNFHTYIVLKPGEDYREFNKKFPEVIDRYVMPQAREYMNIASMAEFEKGGNRLEYSLIPLTDIHLHSSRGIEMGVNGNIQYVYIFTAAALFILLIACINFMNLSTARSAGRAKEVGMRKVLGTERNALIGQFLLESTVMVYFALIAALGLTWLSLPWFNTIAGKEMVMTTLAEPHYLVVLLLFPILVGGLAGIYPAFFLSSFQPVTVLKGKQNATVKKSNFRNFLVIFQFTTSIILVIGTIVIYQQLNHIQNSKIGFDKDQVIVVNNPGLTGENRETFRNEIEKLSGVKSASFGGFLPVANSSRTDNTFATEAVMNSDNAFNMQAWRIDYNYIPTLGMEIVKGRNFSPDFGADSTAIIINETTANLLDGADPIGRKLYSKDEQGVNVEYTIIGVVKNFNFESLRKNIGPLSLRLGNNSWVSAFRINTPNVQSLLNTIETTYKDFAPGMPFSYQFLDEAFDNMYRQEQRIGKVAISFAILAIAIACLGLFGLATYMAEQRTKEIGIRKVLGASASNVVSMLSVDFLRLVFISFMIAAPVSWWVMHKWLEDFAFRISLGWWIFTVTGAFALILALLTVSYQALKAANANPVKSLRTE